MYIGKSPKIFVNFEKSSSLKGWLSSITLTSSRSRSKIFEKTFKTLEQKSTGWRTVSKWDPESKDVNLMAKSLYNYPYGIL